MKHPSSGIVLVTVLVLQLGLAFRPHGLMRQTRNPTMILPDYPPPGERRNYPRPDFEGTSVAQREARDFSNSFNYGVAKNKPMKVAIIGGMHSNFMLYILRFSRRCFCIETTSTQCNHHFYRCRRALRTIHCEVLD